MSAHSTKIEGRISNLFQSRFPPSLFLCRTFPVLIISGMITQTFVPEDNGFIRNGVQKISVVRNHDNGLTITFVQKMFLQPQNSRKIEMIR